VEGAVVAHLVDAGAVSGATGTRAADRSTYATYATCATRATRAASAASARRAIATPIGGDTDPASNPASERGTSGARLAREGDDQRQTSRSPHRPSPPAHTDGM
jgi:hypothetical protein